MFNRDLFDDLFNDKQDDPLDNQTCNHDFDL